MATRLEIYFLASEAPRKGVSSLSPDNVFAAEVSACCNASKLRCSLLLDNILLGGFDGLGFAGDWLLSDWFGWHGKKDMRPIEAKATRNHSSS